MTSESKILTVSYGTFSCTLEGFDNPFDTMKAIAEYFRDLAAQDRHFGAEPPPPDAAMLHRLAEREVSRLAASKADDTARLQNPAEGVAEPLVAPRIQINPVNRRPAVETEAAIEEAVDSTEPSLQDVIPDGVAAKLARIRRAVNPAAAMAAPLSPPDADPELAGPELAVEVEVPAASVAEISDAIADGIAAVAAEFEAETIDADEPVAEATVDEVSPVDEVSFGDEPTLAEASDPVAARLSELIANGAGATDLYDEDEADLTPAASWTEEDFMRDPAHEAEAAPFVEAEADFVTEADLPNPDAVAEDALVDDVPVDDALVAADADLSEVSSEEDLALLAELDGIAAEEALALASVDEPLPEDASAEITLADAVLQDPLPEAEAVAFAEDGPEPVVEAAAAEAHLPEVAAEADEPAPTAGKPRSRSRRVNSRVVRLHPGDDAAGTDDYDFGATRVLASTDESEEIARLMQQADDVMAEDENRRRQEALSRLKAAVASTEADRADIDYEAPKADVHLDPYRDDLAEAIQPDAAPAPQPEPEVKPRRKSVTIRPQEPRPGTIRPGMISPPPLVLVSEQRIDRVVPAAAPAPAPSMAPAAPGISPSLPEGQPMVALRTGRLSGAIGAGAAVAASGMPARNIVLEKPSYGTAAEPEEDEELAEDSREIDESGLSAFAEIVGARSMAEMLEAAAAYATCVENRTHFTRPQLMRRMMASAGGKSVSREDGLRSFGTLLRTGRIEKVTRGHYSLAENSPYLAEARRLS